MRKLIPGALAILALLLGGSLTEESLAQLPDSYAGIRIGMDESQVYDLLEKHSWPYVAETSQVLRIRLQNDYVDSFSLFLIARKVHRIQIVYKPGINNYGKKRFPEMEALLLKKYGDYKDRSNWSMLNVQGESISYVSWVWETASSRLEFRGAASDIFDPPGSATAESHLYTCEIKAKDLEIQQEGSHQEILNPEKLP